MGKLIDPTFHIRQETRNFYVKKKKTLGAAAMSRNRITEWDQIVDLRFTTLHQRSK